MTESIEFLLNPRSIAVVGVSSDPSKLGSVVFNNIIDSGYMGKIYPVNPKYESVYGYKCYSSVTEIKELVDQIIYVIPAQFVPDDAEAALQKKRVHSLVVISAGFKEAGEEGKILEDRLIEISKKYNVRLLGPNCLGYISPRHNLNASFAATSSEGGNIFFLSQSGAVCTSTLDRALEDNLGFHNLISYGNKADINEIDLIDYALRTSSVKTIGVYVEEISDGGELYTLLKSSKSKPVVLLNPGESERAQQAISSHTGSLAGGALFRRQALIQAGIVLAEGMEEMFNLMKTFSWLKSLSGKRIGIITNAGGPGVIATDSIVRNGLEVAELTKQTQELLSHSLPPASSSHNPVDVLGDADAERYRVSINALIEDENVDLILVILTPQLITQIEETAKLIIGISEYSSKPIIPVFIGGKYTKAGLDRFNDNEIPSFTYIDDAVKALSKVINYHSNIKTYTKLFPEQNEFIKAGKIKRKSIGEMKKLTSPSADISALDEKTVGELAKHFKIKMPGQLVTSSLDKIQQFSGIYDDIVLKATTKELVHKTDQKAVYLDLKTKAEIERAYKELQVLLNKEMKTKTKKYELLVQEKVESGEEVFIGIKRDGSSSVYSDPGDKGFGHLMLFGKGGIYTEIYKDITARLLPLSPEGFKDFINSVKVSQILDGARGGKKLAAAKLIELMESLQNMIFAYPEIHSIDVNPVIVTEEEAVAVDLKVFTQK